MITHGVTQILTLNSADFISFAGIVVLRPEGVTS